jgi:hypothetical protein
VLTADESARLSATTVIEKLSKSSLLVAERTV